jgi:hypothetical protein
MRVASIALAGLIALLVLWVVVFMIGNLLGSGSVNGCNHVPIVNGQPAYQCSSQP